MRAQYEACAYVLVCGAAFVVTWLLTAPGADEVVASPKTLARERAPLGGTLVAPAVDEVQTALDVVRTQVEQVTHDAGTVKDVMRLTALRNDVIEAAAEDMHRRGASVSDCLGGLELAGLNKLRFAARVHATPRDVEITRWRFVEIVDGEVLPAGFAPCVEQVLGGPQRTSADHDTYPPFDGELDVIYFLPGG